HIIFLIFPYTTLFRSGIMALFYRKLKRWQHINTYKQIPVLVAAIFVCRALNILLVFSLVKDAIPNSQFAVKFMNINFFYAGALRSEEHTSELQSRENL